MNHVDICSKLTEDIIVFYHISPPPATSPRHIGEQLEALLTRYGAGEIDESQATIILTFLQKKSRRSIFSGVL
ncbi:MAG: hypothetical protein ACYSW8_14850 [Planctomycetota bacterium]|jgi:hypothetical protein